MKNCLLLGTLFFSVIGFGQEKKEPEKKETTYKKRVLESTEVSFLSSFYKQNGNNAAVTGGVGTEELTDVTPTLTISIPLNDDDVLTIDGGISAYSSASSSNLDPFDSSTGASGAGGSYEGDDDDDDDDHGGGSTGGVQGSPWVASSGASSKDVWGTFSVAYSHSSDDRNKIWSANASFAAEYDYVSFGVGGGYTQLFNEKNTELGIKGSVFLDTWKPVYPTELDSYLEANQDTNNGFFSGIDILNANGNTTVKNSATSWKPFNTTLIQDKGRNNYTVSLSFSQILSKRLQVSFFADFIMQQGWLANPMQRVYFKDRPNYYIGNGNSISNYTSSQNTDVFHLADDIERLPDLRIKTPIGARVHYYLNEFVVLRTYYRYYRDNWGLTSNTMQLELPLKLIEKWTITPGFRYYNQTAIDYFKPYNEHLSTDQYYTSDYDVSQFNAQQYSLGLTYTDIFTKRKIWKFGIKSVDLKYSNYQRSTGLNANIITIGIKAILD